MTDAPRPGIPGSLVSHYEYDLPADRIARYPAPNRDESRLLVVDRKGSEMRHLRFRNLPELFRPDDLLVVNESRVLPVRLLGRKPSGAPAEILLLRPAPEARGIDPREAPGTGLPAGWEDARLWEALVRPGGKLKPGRRVEISRELEVEILDSLPGGGRLVRLVTDMPGEGALQRFGHMPLPPYLEREDEPLDRERYQTVYARAPGSVAAPTAGLHFTNPLLDELALRGVGLAKLTLHVGVGTFRPVESEDPGKHEMHPEAYTVTPDAAEAVNAARNLGGRIWAVGTTVVRTLESSAGEDGRVRPGSGQTDLFIRPPYRFRVVNRLVTNFHLPRSTLLMLVAAFAGYERTMEAYANAVAEGYRFYSYGDAMVVL
ncbi:MAG: tRNA preQ1(34) S-adenosylmethionine ribosyltransferase-isomerase QueA [Gemmatimonadota bacterium]